MGVFLFLQTSIILCPKLVSDVVVQNNACDETGQTIITYYCLFVLDYHSSNIITVFTVIGGDLRHNYCAPRYRLYRYRYYILLPMCGRPQTVGQDGRRQDGRSHGRVFFFCMCRKHGLPICLIAHTGTIIRANNIIFSMLRAQNVVMVTKPCYRQEPTTTNLKHYVLLL